MVYGRSQRRLSAETLGVTPVSRQRRVQHLEGDDLSALGIEAPVDGPLAARGDLIEDLVTPYALFHGAN